MLKTRFRLMSSFACLALLGSLTACQNTNPPGTINTAILQNELAPGGLSASEWQTEVNKLNQDYFEALDTNRDGNLTLEEAKVPSTAKEPASLEALAPGLDTNKDGIWQAAEYSKFMPDFVKAAKKANATLTFIIPIYILKESVNYLWQVTDDNKDGFLTVKDYVDSVKKTCPSGCDPANTEKTAQEEVKKMDKNGDGKISYAEYQRNTIKDQRDGMLEGIRKGQALRSANAAAQASPAPATQPAP